MSLKLKISLGVLLLIAGFLVVRLGLYFKQSTEVANSQNGTEVLGAKYDDPLEADTDGDGLTDRDEIIYGTNPFDKDTDGDGYLDGEEIASEYDPLDPSVNSKLMASKSSLTFQTTNLTDRFLNLTVASLVDDTGELNPDQMTTQTYADILQSVGNEAALSTYVRPISDSEIKIAQDNDKKTIEKYLKSAIIILEEGLFSSSTGIMSGLSTVGDPNSTYHLSYENAYNSLKTLEVPSSWKEIHKTTLVVLAQLATSFKAMGNFQDDPIRATFALNQIQDSSIQLLNLLNQASNLANLQEIPTEDSILQIIQSANSYLPTPVNN